MAALLIGITARSGSAQMTGIHKTSFYTQAVVNGGPIDPRQRYTAWSCMKTLLNATPPVGEAQATPMRAESAAFRDVVVRGSGSTARVGTQARPSRRSPQY